MKIVTLCFPGVGGSGILATSLAAALAEQNHQVHILSSETPVQFHSREKNLTFHRVAQTKHAAFSGPDYVLTLAATLAKLCRDERVDIVHAHYALPHVPAALLGIDSLENNKPALVATLHGTDVTRFGKDPILGRLVQSALNRCQVVTAVSDFLCHEANQLFTLESQIHRVYNFCRPLRLQNRRDVTREELGVGTQELLALHMSNLRPVKRFDRVLEAFAKSRVDKLVVLNGGNVKPYLGMIESLGIQERVLVRETSNIEDFIEASDLGLYASEEESFGLGILETMACAKPVVATLVGGIPEVVGETGLLVDSGDVDGLCSALNRMKDEPNLRLRLASEAKMRALSRYSKQRALDQYLELYARATKRLVPNN